MLPYAAHLNATSLSPAEERMQRILTIIISLLISVCATAAPLVRVQSIRDGRTIVIEGGAVVRLSGVEITNDVAAQDLLRWTIGTSWILVERNADGTARVYRSPDALFVNRELVLRGYARATEPGIEPEERIQVTYLGVANPGPRVSEPAVRPPAARTHSDKSARSPASPASRPRRSPTGARRGR